MRRSAVALLPVLGVLLFAACSERDTTSPHLPGAASFSQTLSPATSCDFTQINKSANNYFKSKQDPVYTLIGNMKLAGGGSAAATTIGWQILKAVAGERLTSATGAASDGAVFVNDVLRCTTYTFPPTASPDVKQNFLDNLSLILSGGIFNVRGNGFAPDPAAALDGSGSPQIFAQPRWGVEAAPNWPTGPALIWGYPVLIPNVVVSPATNINTNGTGGPYNGFELGTMPDTTTKTGMRVGVCFATTTGNTAANRLFHNNNQIVLDNSPGALCSMPTPVASIDARSWYTRALARAASLLAPATAQAMQDESFIGGLPSSWSPFESGAIIGTNVQLVFTAQPQNGRAGQTVPFTVNATINGVPVPGLDVTVSIDNNQGSPAGAIITGGTNPVTTDAQGNAVFGITIGKPGGYLIAAVGGLSGIPTNTFVSAQFNLKQAQ